MKLQLLKNIALKILIIPFIILLWQVAYFYNLFQGNIPNLIDVFRIYFEKESLFELLYHLGRTLSVFIKCLLFGGIIGYTFGILIGMNKYMRQIFYHTFNALKSIPVTIFIPIAIIVIGISNFFVPLISIPVIAIIAVNMADSCQNINHNRFNTLTLINVQSFSYFRHIIWFETLEVFFSTLRIVVPYIIALEIALDYFMHINKGLGYYINLNYAADVKYLPNMYAGIMVVALLGVILVKIVDIISKKSIVWKQRI